MEVTAGAEPLAGLAPGAWIRLTVADTGAGIEAAMLEHIGEEALPFLLDNSVQPDLIIGDVVMPRLGGIGLFKTLYSAGAQIPMLFITGHPMHDELDGLRKMGRCAAMTKPITLEQLAQTLAAILVAANPPADGADFS